MTHARVLLQLDTDPLPSSFDAIVAIDAGVDRLLSYGSVDPQSVTALVHGAIFTRSPKQLSHTAIFVGGSRVEAAEALLRQVKSTFFGPFRVSVLLDANGANTTAAAAVLAASRHLILRDSTALVLAGTGPVGQRVARLLSGEGATVRVASRRRERAEQACQAIATALDERPSPTPRGALQPCQVAEPSDAATALDGCQLVISAGAAGICLLPIAARQEASALQVAVDLNAVPPLGIEGTEATDAGAVREGVTCYGALGIGGSKMQLHRAAVQQLFSDNQQVLDAEEVFALAKSLGQGT